MNEILIFLLSLAGAFVLRVCGFGFGVFTMAWLPYLLPSYGEATTLSGILAMAGSILVAFKNWRKIDWHKLRRSSSPSSSRRVPPSILSLSPTTTC